MAVETTEYLRVLVQAVGRKEPALFTDYVDWAALRGETVGEHLVDLRKAVDACFSPAAGELAKRYLDLTLQRSALEAPSSCFDESVPLHRVARQYLTALLEGRREGAWDHVVKAMAAGASVQEIYLQVFQPAQRELGRLWQLNEISVAQEHYCTAATQLLLTRLQERVFSAPRRGRLAVVAAVGSELHEMGPRMVADFFEMAGWDTRFLGAWLPPAEVVAAAEQLRPSIVCLACTMTTHLPELEAAVAGVRRALPAARILVGGLPFNISPNLWRSVGADGCASDAAEAVRLAESWAAA